MKKGSTSLQFAAARRARHRSGHRSEWLAALLLMVKGYRILSRREKTPVGEIDLIAVRGGRIAFVEVKRRLTLEDAQASITPRQRQRILRAAELWLARNTYYQSCQVSFDVVFVIKGRWPKHIMNALV